MLYSVTQGGCVVQNMIFVLYNNYVNGPMVER